MSNNQVSSKIRNNPAPINKGGKNPPPNTPKPEYKPPASVKK